MRLQTQPKPVLVESDDFMLTSYAYEENYQRMLDCPAELIGIRGDSAKSIIRDILFENITVGGERLHALDQLKTNEFVQNVTIR